MYTHVLTRLPQQELGRRGTMKVFGYGKEDNVGYNSSLPVTERLFCSHFKGLVP